MDDIVQGSMVIQSKPKDSPGQVEIDRDSFEPAYNQLVNILLRKIASGEYRPGDQLPSEAELCSQYQVSSITSRRAIKMLVQQDVAATIQGRGTFVKPPKLSAATFGLQGLQAIFSNPRATVNILEAMTVPADDRAARKLWVSPQSRVIYIRRLISLDDVPLIYHREYLTLDPTQPTVESELEVTTLHGLFDGTGSAGFKWGDLDIQATVLNEEEGSLFQLPPRFPAFCLEHIFYDYSDHPTSWGWFICRADRISFKTSVGLSSVSI